MVGQFPHVREQFAPRDDLVRARHEQAHRVDFLFRQRDDTLPRLRLPGAEVDPELPEGVALGPWVGEFAGSALIARPCLPPEQSLDAREQFGKVERLGHVVVGAEFQPIDDVVWLGPRGQHQDRREVPIAAQLLTHLEAIHLWQANVEDHQVEALGAHALEGLASVARDLDDMMLPLQVDTDAVGDGLFVFDDEDAGGLGHDRPPATGSRTTRRVPARPSCENAITLPFISLTSPSTIERPSPVPPRRSEISRPIW